MPLPTRQDINVHDSLDERSACEHFLGKSLLEAETLFRENSLYYQEDLMFMGASAFRFYLLKDGGRRRIRTFGGVSQQIYSLPSLAT